MPISKGRPVSNRDASPSSPEHVCASCGARTDADGVDTSGFKRCSTSWLNMKLDHRPVSVDESNRLINAKHGDY